MYNRQFLEMKVVAAIFTLFLLLNFSLAQNEFSPIVTVEQGQIQGLVLQSRKGNTYYAYLGVPYAKKPERFEPAEFPDKWNGIKEAKTYGNVCPQYDGGLGGPIGDEDCLFLNIMTKNVSGNLPVMVYIHGGGFKFTSGDGFGGKYWMDADVVLVTLNYRVAAMGFLSTGDSVIQGNYGLKDQALCLKWIQQNIQNFGGDIDKVTIFGESAGGASVNYHLISQMSNGLFKNAISQSGAAINPWAFQFNPLKQAQKLAGFLNCPTTNSTVMKTCFKSKSAAEIAGAITKFEEWNAHPLYPFPPSIEITSSESKDPAFLTDNPFRLMSEGKVNKNLTWVTGVNEAEGIFYVGSVTNENGYPQDVKLKRNELLPKIFFFDDSVRADSKNSITEDIWKFYSDGSEGISVENMSNLFGDRFFNFGVRETAKLYAKYGTVYPYYFAKRGSFSWGEAYFGKNGLTGATHCDELNWQFNLTFGTDHAPEFPSDSDYEKFSENFINLWASIANDGKPSSTWAGEEKEWLPIDSSQGMLKWYKIDDNPSSIDLPFESRMKFWDQLSIDMDEWKMNNNGATPFIVINIFSLTFCSFVLQIILNRLL